MALKVLHKALKDDFGFENILWIYSGRRGIHCWVCDPSARNLSNEERSSIVEYLSMPKLSLAAKEGSRSSASDLNHPLFERSFDIVEPLFCRYIADEVHGQGLLSTDSGFRSFVADFPDEDVLQDILRSVAAEKRATGAKRWEILKEHIVGEASSAKPQKRKKTDAKQLQQWMREKVLHHCYPRLDANVSKAQNHLLKSPFCVHPKTGRVCVPIDPDRADDFDPATVPTVRSLAAQVQNASFQHNFLVLINLLLWQQLDANGSDASKTDMKEAMDLFAKTFGRSLETSNRCEHCDKSLHCFLLIYTTSSEKSSAKEEIDCSSFNTE